jgi:hypothetical protein
MRWWNGGCRGVSRKDAKSNSRGLHAKAQRIIQEAQRFNASVFLHALRDSVVTVFLNPKPH